MQPGDGPLTRGKSYSPCKPCAICVSWGTAVEPPCKKQLGGEGVGGGGVRHGLVRRHVRRGRVNSPVW